MSNKISLSDVSAKVVLPGFSARFVHTENLTFAWWDIKAAHHLPVHAHVHEQVLNLIEGEFELTIDGVSHHLTTGDVFVIHSNVEHSGRSITDCRILDVFSPVREDYIFS